MYIVAGIIVAIVVFLSVGYVKSPPNTATIISGPGKHPRVLIGKAGFKIPFLERVDRMGIGQIDIDIETEDYIPTKDFINIQVDAIAQVAVDTSPENIEIAMRNFLNKSSDDVRNTITKSLQGNLREIIGTMELKDICQNKAEFSEQVKSNAKEDIAQLGICILSFNVQNIKDKDGLINDLGIDNTEEMKKTICDMNSLTMELKDKTAEINTVVEQINNIVIQNSKVSLNQDEYNKEYFRLKRKYDTIASEIDRLSKQIKEKDLQGKLFDNFISTFKKQNETISEFDEFLWSGLVYEIVVYTKQDVRFFLKNGLEIDTGL